MSLAFISWNGEHIQVSSSDDVQKEHEYSEQQVDLEHGIERIECAMVFYRDTLPHPRAMVVQPVNAQTTFVAVRRGSGAIYSTQMAWNILRL